MTDIIVSSVDVSFCRFVSCLRMHISKSPIRSLSLTAATDNSHAERTSAFWVSKALLLSNCLNLSLLFVKAFTLVVTRRKAFIASLVDSFADCVFGLSLSVLAVYLKPRRREFPVGFTFCQDSLSVVLSFMNICLALLNVDDDVRAVVSRTAEHYTVLERSVASSVLSINVLVKLGLWLLCRSSGNSQIRMLAKDHLTDVATNVIPLVVFIYGNASPWYLDPLTGLIVNMYVFVVWVNVVRLIVRRLSWRMKPSLTLPFSDTTHRSEMSDGRKLYIIGIRGGVAELCDAIRVHARTRIGCESDTHLFLYKLFTETDNRISDESSTGSVGVTDRVRQESVQVESDILHEGERAEVVD